MTHEQRLLRDLHHPRHAVHMLGRDALLAAIVRGWHAKVILHAKQKEYREKVKGRQ